MRPLFLMGALALLATGCSLIAGAGLEQCQTSADCEDSDNMVCTENFCLPLPAGCGQRFGSEEPDALPLAALVPISTSTAPGADKDESDEQALNAAVLALLEANQRGVGGRRFALHMCDTAGDPARTRRQAEWVVKEKKVAAVLTAGSRQTLDVAAVTVPAGVLTMSYSASSPELTALADTNGGPVGLVWRTSPSDAIQGRVIAEQLATNPSRFPDLQRIRILYVDDPYGQGLYNVISSRLAVIAPSLNVGGIKYVRRGDPSNPVAQLNQEDPDITVLMGSADDAMALLRQSANQSNLSRASGHRWFFSDSVKDATVLADPTVRDLVQGFYGTAPAQGTGQAYASFASSFRSEYAGKNPDDYAYTANAYDAMYLLTLGAAYSLGTTHELTGAKMAEGLTRVSTGASSSGTQLTNANFIPLSTELAAGRPVNVEGASGKLDFDASGEAPAPIELWQVSGGSFLPIATLEPAN